MGLVPPLSKKGDVLYYIRGGHMPAVLRSMSSQVRTAEWIGVCYISNIEDIYRGLDWEFWKII
jgi:hypothetical protein